MIEPFHFGKEFLLGGGGGQAEHSAVETDLLAGTLLVSYVSLAGTVIPYENCGQMRPAPTFVEKEIYLCGNLCLKARRCGFSVK